MGGWTSVLILGEDRIEFNAGSKKQSEKGVWAEACLKIGRGYIDAFIEGGKSVKEKVRDVLEEGLEVFVGESGLLRMDKLMGELRSSNAFHCRDDVPRDKVDGEDGEIVDDGDVALEWDAISAGMSSSSYYSSPRTSYGNIITPKRFAERDLPMCKYYESLISTIEAHSVIIVAAETGAGKTTQLPQFLLERGTELTCKYGAYNPSHPESSAPPPVNIIVTQPRRIAAISVAQRVATERGEVIGRRSAIGYQVRFEDKKPTSDPNYGQATFCTSGILLRRFQMDPLLKGVTHVILDEVHERDLNTDLLLIVTRHLLSRRPDLKLILMSATADTHLFQSYFSSRSSQPPPVIQIPGRLFPVNDHCLDDILPIIYRDLSPRFCEDTMDYINREMDCAAPSSKRVDETPYDLIEAMLAHIILIGSQSTSHYDDTNDGQMGAILVFLPGWNEIQSLMDRLKDFDNFRVGFSDPRRCRLLALHSSVPVDEQQLVFERPPRGVWKIILSTNIAETSVTIDDVVYVVDLGKIRINTYDANTRVSSLNSTWASISNIKQRSGRAGRCQVGNYFALFSRRRRSSLAISTPPDLLRVDLASTVLRIKSLSIAPKSTSIMTLLSLAPEPPLPSTLNRAVTDLYTLGALNPKDESLTPLGNFLSTLPVDPWIGKFILMGLLFKCLDPILTLAAAISLPRGIYAIHPDDRARARQGLLTWFGSSTRSDHLALLNAVEAWRSCGSRGGYQEQRRFATARFLHGVSLTHLEKSRTQLLRCLNDSGFMTGNSYDDNRVMQESVLGGREFNENSGNQTLIRALLCGALFPNIAQVNGKDEYRSKSEGKLRLTSGSVNSWKALNLSASIGAPNPMAVIPGGGAGGASYDSSSRYYDKKAASSDLLDSVPDDPEDGGEDVAATMGISVLPSRLLCFQEKQRVDGLVYMRSTTCADPLALILLGGGPDSMWWDRFGANDIPVAVLDGWIYVKVQNDKSARLLDDTRTMLSRFLNWVVWSRAIRESNRFPGNRDIQEGDLQGKMLVQQIIGLLDSGIQQ